MLPPAPEIICKPLQAEWGYSEVVIQAKKEATTKQMPKNQEWIHGVLTTGRRKERARKPTNKQEKKKKRQDSAMSEWKNMNAHKSIDRIISVKRRNNYGPRPSRLGRTNYSPLPPKNAIIVVGKIKECIHTRQHNYGPRPDGQNDYTPPQKRQ